MALFNDCVSRQVRTSPGAAYELGHNLVVWCAEFPHLRPQLPTQWSRLHVVATVGAAFAQTVQRYLETHYERVGKGSDRA